MDDRVSSHKEMTDQDFLRQLADDVKDIGSSLVRQEHIQGDFKEKLDTITMMLLRTMYSWLITALRFAAEFLPDSKAALKPR